MIVHCRVTLGNKFTSTHLYTWVWRGTVRVKCLAQKDNTMSLARARTTTARSGDKYTNHEATTFTHFFVYFFCLFSFFSVYLVIIYSSYSTSKMLLDSYQRELVFVAGSRVAELEMYLLVAKVNFTIKNF